MPDEDPITEWPGSELPLPPEPSPESLADPKADYERFKAQAENIEDEPEVDVLDFTLEDVANFAYERQAIWHRRFVQQLPPPWTDDEVMREWRICNIYRELDRGTKYVLDHVVNTADHSSKEKLFNVAIYRLLNRVESWEKYVGWLDPPYHENFKDAVARLEEAFAAGESVNTSAWRAANLSELLRAGLLIADRLDELDALCSVANSLQMIHAILSKGYEIGDFTAYQVSLDIQYVYPNLDNSDWVFIYGRATRTKHASGGSLWAFRKLGEPHEEPIDVARRLRDTQDEWLPEGWADVAPDFRPRLGLAEVDNIMCEFRKYWLKRHGMGALRRFGEEPAKRQRSSGSRTRSSATNWETPPDLFWQLNEQFGPFTVDAAASENNAMCERYWSIVDDGLRQSWKDETVFCHPPFGDMSNWTAKAAAERQRAKRVVMLCPAYVETKWWNDYIAEQASEVHFVKGQPQFYENGEPRPKTFGNSMAIVVWEPTSSVSGPRVAFGYTWPGRVVVPRSGWTGTT